MDRLQLISVIVCTKAIASFSASLNMCQTTFFASTEAQLLAITTPNSGVSGTVAEQVANAALTGALVFHSFAGSLCLDSVDPYSRNARTLATLSFTAAFVLVRFRLKEATKDEHQGTDKEKRKIWSSNPHVAMQRVGYHKYVYLPINVFCAHAVTWYFSRNHLCTYFGVLTCYVYT